MQDDNIAISNGWVTKLLKDKSDAYSYVVTNQQKTEAVIHDNTEDYIHYGVGILSLIGSIISFPFSLLNSIIDPDKDLAGDIAGAPHED